MGPRAPSRRLKTKQAVLGLIEQAARLGDPDALAYLAAHSSRSALPPLEFIFVCPETPRPAIGARPESAPRSRAPADVIKARPGFAPVGGFDTTSRGRAREATANAGS
jgi:hypothetical protein